MQVTLSKIDAAEALLNRAFALYLDHEDYVNATVLAGSAEDILHGELVRKGRVNDAARTQMAGAAQALARRFDPAGEMPSKAEAYNLLRNAFNWLRHNDKVSEPTTMTWDFEKEAALVLFRALQNWDLLGLPDLPRAQDFVRVETAKPD